MMVFRSATGCPKCHMHSFMSSIEISGVCPRCLVKLVRGWVDEDTNRFLTPHELDKLNGETAFDLLKERMDDNAETDDARRRAESTRSPAAGSSDDHCTGFLLSGNRHYEDCRDRGCDHAASAEEVQETFGGCLWRKGGGSSCLTMRA